MDLAQQFFELFAGLDRAHGVTVVTTEKKDSGKTKSKSWLEWKPLTVALWEQHLAGKQGLGVVPIRDNGTVRWGAIDIDQYDLDHNALNKKVNDLHLPLVVARSKSGGAHAFLFCKEDTSAELVRAKLAEWAAALGHSGVEVFPKQSGLATKKDVGNWLNMPYFDADNTLRYALSKHAKGMRAETFVEYAQSLAVTEERLEKITSAIEGSAYWDGAPPCLEKLSVGGFEEGSRNKVLFNVGVYLARRYPNDWLGKLEHYNDSLFIPPLGPKEVRTVARSLNNKKYSYTCKDDPLNGVCRRPACLKRMFGVGNTLDDLGLDVGVMQILLQDPPMFSWMLNEQRVEFTAPELLNQGKFRQVCTERLFKIPATIKGPTWLDLIQEAMDEADRQEVPTEATPEGQIWEALDDFCTGRAPARHKDEILNGKPWTESGRTYFRIRDFRAYLKVIDIPGNPQQIYRWLRKRGCTTGLWTIKGKQVKWWAVDEFDKQTEDSEVPRVEAEF